MNSLTTKERFENYFIPEPNTGCWLWTNSLSKYGYGKFSIKKKSFPAHRMSYILYVGKIKDGFDICHTCDVRCCVNPNHLFMGTHSDNMKDMVSKGRINPRHGNFNWNAKLTDDIVLEIKRVGRSAMLKDLAKKYNVTTTTISYIINNKSWKHLCEQKPNCLYRPGDENYGG